MVMIVFSSCCLYMACVFSEKIWLPFLQNIAHV
jgi:hypothetical protein